MYPLDDTIAAIASPPGGAARGIVRISGPRALECLMPLFQPDGERPLASSPFPHVLAGTIRLPGLHSPLPCDAYFWLMHRPTSVDTWVACPERSDGRDVTRSHALRCSGRATPQFNSVKALGASSGKTPSPPARSYTGQPVVEIHTLGSPPLLQLLLRSICVAGARLAGPGEFTLRAFLAGRLDLTQAEAVLGVIDAGDTHELRTALDQLAGGLARPLHRLRDGLLELLAHVEAGFDFADEDIAFLTREELDQRLSAAANDVAAVQRQMASRSESTDAVRAVLVGRPNTGKSSLFNAISGGRGALVSDHPGTTRDYLAAELDLDGVKCQLIDTAGTSGQGSGIRDQGSGVRDGAKRENVTRDGRFTAHWPGPDARGPREEIDAAAESAAAAQRRAAHLHLLCLDSTRSLDAWERSELARTDAQRIVVLTKCDAPRQTDLTQAAVETSSVTGQGIAALRQQLQRTLALAGGHGDVVAGTAVRCAESLRLAGLCLGNARQVASVGQDELAAAEIRLALEELGKVVGAVYTEDVLDRIFSRFCVGK